MLSNEGVSVAFRSMELQWSGQYDILFCEILLFLNVFWILEVSFQRGDPVSNECKIVCIFLSFVLVVL